MLAIVGHPMNLAVDERGDGNARSRAKRDVRIVRKREISRQKNEVVRFFCLSLDPDLQISRLSSLSEVCYQADVEVLAI